MSVISKVRAVFSRAGNAEAAKDAPTRTLPSDSEAAGIAVYGVLESRVQVPLFVIDGHRCTTVYGVAEVMVADKHGYRKLAGAAIDSPGYAETYKHVVATDSHGALTLPKKGLRETPIVRLSEVSAIINAAWPRKGSELVARIHKRAAAIQRARNVQ